MLYDALFATLWRIAVKHTRSPEIAEDVVHEVFLSVWIRREQLQPDIDFRTYLATAVRYRARARWAHEHVVRASEEAVTHGLVDPLGMGQGMAAPDLVLERAELQSLYRHAVGTLTDREREAALLRWEEGFTIEQIAKILGLSVAGVHGVLLRAQRKVQTAVAAYRG